MPSYTAAERAMLAGVLPELADLERELRRRAEAEGIVYVIPAFGGLRTEADQRQLLEWRDQAVARGEPSYPVAPADRSFHSAGAAFDLKVVRTGELTPDAAYTRLGVIGESIGLVWGGRWTRRDPFHFQLAGTLDDNKARFAAYATSGALTVAVVGFLVWYIRTRKG